MLNATFEGRTRFRMLETLRTFGLDRLAAAGEADAAAGRLLRWAVELTTWIDAAIPTDREPEADTVLRRELPNLRAAWRLARQQRSLDAAAALVTALNEASAWRDLIELRAGPRSWSTTSPSPPTPGAVAVLGTAADVAYMRVDSMRADRLARAGLEQATDADGRWHCLSSLSLADLIRGAYADSIEHALAATALQSRPSETIGVAALAAAYGGDLHQARELSDQMTATATWPTLRGFAAYVAGEIDSASGRRE
jgi:hypothetical protein